MEFVHAGILKENETQPYLRNLQLSSEISRRLQPISNIKSVHAISGFCCSSDSATLIQIRKETTRQPITKKPSNFCICPIKEPFTSLWATQNSLLQQSWVFQLAGQNPCHEHIFLLCFTLCRFLSWFKCRKCQFSLKQLLSAFWLSIPN